MKYSLMLGIAISVGFGHAACAQTVPGDVTVQDQWFTGTLEAPSPALPKADLLVVKPFVIFTRTDGAYDSKGEYHSTSDSDTFKTVVLMKYGITDRLSIQALPSIAHVDGGNSHYTGLGDLPIEAEYRINDENNKTGFPSVTVAAGLNLPTGKYDDLQTSSSGFGGGALTLKEQVLLQSLFDTPGGHPMRLRAYAAAYQPLGTASVDNISAYGTGQGFTGRVNPGASVVLGVGGGFAFDQRWVVAMDLVYKSARGFQLDGNDPVDGLVHSESGRRSTTSFAPALEYNLSGHLGIIAGVDFSIAGHNSTSYFAPQFAVSMSF
ncbi:hypothetical protein ACVWYO_004607 [Sphingomonas sp. UYP23]